MRLRFTAALAAALAILPCAALAVPQIGKPAPPLVLPALQNGPPIDLAKLRGKPVYVNFFASWCGPCASEASSIGAVRARFASRGLTVVGVDELDQRPSGLRFISTYHRPYTLTGFDEAGTVGRAYGAIAMPVHVFIGRDGVVRLFRLGEMTAAQIAAAAESILR